jgi:peptide/nickel transport system permease protein
MPSFVSRVLQRAPVLFIVSLISFYIVFLAPGDPAAVYRHNDMTVEEYQRLREEMGFNDPLSRQYFRWLGKVCQGDWGYSLAKRQPVLDLIAPRIGPTLGLMGFAIAFSVAAAIVIGLLAAYKANSLVDHCISLITYIGISIPTAWLALLLIIVFSLRGGLLPSSGMRGSGVASWVDLIRHAILPVAAISFSKISGYTRYVRANAIAQLSQPYVTAAIAKGLSPAAVLFRHVLKNSVLPLITMVGMNMGSLVMGTFIIENIFGWPGLGTLCFGAISNRDFPLVMGTTMLSCLLLIVGNMGADLLYAVVDPRVKTERRGRDGERDA